MPPRNGPRHPTPDTGEDCARIQTEVLGGIASNTRREGVSGEMTILKRLGAVALLACTLLGAAPLAAPAFAQQSNGSSQPDLVPVMLWTFVIALVVCSVLGVGYLYRRARGAADERIPRTVDPYYAQEGHEEKHSTAELHPEMAHDAVGIHADEPAQPGAPGRELTAPDPSGRALHEETEMVATSERGAPLQPDHHR